MEALDYGKRLSRKIEEAKTLFWCIVDKDREENFPEFFDDSLWQILQRRVARIFSGVDDHLRTMFVWNVFMFFCLTLCKNKSIGEILNSSIDCFNFSIEAGIKALPRLVAVRPILSNQDVFAVGELPTSTDAPLRYHSRVICPTKKVGMRYSLFYFVIAFY